MVVRTVLFTALAAAALLQGYNDWQLRPVHPSDGPIAPADPQQMDADGAQVTTLGRWRLKPRARYDITARILSREDYHFDLLADLVPEDLALGWGPMSDNRILRTIDISQSNRFYYWREDARQPLPRNSIITHSANTHVIPGNSMVAKQLARLRPGEVVTLSGELVDGVRDDGMWIRTSLVRDDTGAGACEVLLVSDVAVLPR